MIYISANTAAVDAAMVTKDRAVRGLAEYHKIPLEELAVIGDELIDIPMLSIEGIGLAGAPSNAQDKVKEAVERRKGFIAQSKVLDGFLEFYEEARSRGITHIVSDRDGVLVKKGDLSRGKEFQSLAMQMGNNNNPYVSILTGSGMEQNIGFMEKYGLNANLAKNQEVQRFPYLLLVENGTIHVNVLTGETINYCKSLNPYFLAKLKGEFEEIVRQKLEQEVFPTLNLEWSTEYADQAEKVYIAPKQSMSTFNIPRKFRDGSDYRSSENAALLRKAIAGIMAETADKLGMPHTML
ncbi:MAG: HAD hydrolase family protein [Nanoarchaeota archaeon]|nr:HAD hydrolase family protein [Nanoarchaeota archaeon]